MVSLAVLVTGLVCFFAAIIVSTTNAAPSSWLTAELNEEWETFKVFHRKNYISNTEEVMRRVIWEQNVRYIQKHNLEYDRGLHTYSVGMNEYGDMSNEEFRKMMNGYRSENQTRTGALFMPPSHVSDTPESVDWRKEGYVTPVKNQRQCGSCWAFSATGSLEGQHYKKTRNLVSLSEQNLVDCSRAEGNMGCGGGLMDQAFKYIKINHGIDTEQCYPYKAIDQKCQFKASCIGATDTSYTDIASGDEQALKQAVATVGPISVAIDAGHRSFQLYKHGVYNEPMCSSTRLDHGVLAVGYGVYQGQNYWLVKNSWGESYGQAGYIWMSRDKNNQCGIATQASYPLV